MVILIQNSKNAKQSLVTESRLKLLCGRRRDKERGWVTKIMMDMFTISIVVVISGLYTYA